MRKGLVCLLVVALWGCNKQPQPVGDEEKIRVQEEVLNEEQLDTIRLEDLTCYSPYTLDSIRSLFIDHKEKEYLESRQLDRKNVERYVALLPQVEISFDAIVVERQASNLDEPTICSANIDLKFPFIDNLDNDSYEKIKSDMRRSAYWYGAVASPPDRIKYKITKGYDENGIEQVYFEVDEGEAIVNYISNAISSYDQFQNIKRIREENQSIENSKEKLKTTSEKSSRNLQQNNQSPANSTKESETQSQQKEKPETTISPASLESSQVPEWKRQPKPRLNASDLSAISNSEPILRVDVNESGGIKASIVSSSGSDKVDNELLRAVQQARFQPYIENGVAASFYAEIPFALQ